MTAKPFFKTRFAIRPTEDSEGDHWIGGSGNFTGATCPNCKVPLMLLMDFNCKDPVLRKATRGKLKNLKRLPLYHCLRCWSVLSYLVDEKQAVRVIHTEGGNHPPISGDDPSYANYLTSFLRRPVGLDSSVPPGLKKVVDKWNNSENPWRDVLTKAERQLVEEYFGHPIWIPRYCYHHQLGGEPLIDSWDDWDGTALFCRNKNCPGGLLEKLTKRRRPLKFLAGVLNEPRLGLHLYQPDGTESETKWNCGLSIYFQICDKCLAITSNSAVD